MALLSLGALSCTREQEAPVQKPVESNVVTLGAVYSPKTKAAISDEAAFSWQEGDVISVATSNGLADFALTQGAGSTSATFTGRLEGATIGDVAIYPAGKHKVEASAVTVNLPAEYVFLEDNTNIPLVGVIEDDKVEFEAIGGVARIKAGIPEGAVKVVLAADKVITGDFLVGDDGIVAGESTPSAVSYTFPAVESKTNMTFNFPLPAGEYNLKFSVLDASDKVLAELEASAAHTISVADVLVFDELAFPELNVTLNGTQGFATIQEAVNAAAELTSGTANIVLKEGSAFAEEVKITGNADDKDLAGNDLKPITVPVVIDGGATTTALTGSIEVSRVPVQIKNLSVTVTETSKLSLAGTYTNSAWFTAIHASVGGYGLEVDNVILNLPVGSCTGIWLASKDEGSNAFDVIKNCQFKGAQRGIQAYATDVKIIDNEFNDYTGNIIRIGNDGVNYGAKYIIYGNSFTSTGNAINFYNIDNSLIDLTENGGQFGNELGTAGMTANVTLAEKSNLIIPALVQDGTAVTVAEEDGPLTRVWGKWTVAYPEWDDEICDPSANNWDRHAAVVGQYLYVPSASRTETKVAVFDVLTGEQVCIITEGFDLQYGLFKLCSIAKLGEAVYVSSMSNSGKLAIYKLTDLEGGHYTKATLAKAIDVPAGERFGDDMTSLGDDSEGSLIFCSYAVTGATADRTRLIWEFFVNDGVIADEPIVPVRGVTAAGNFIGGLYIYEYTYNPQGHLRPDGNGSSSERHGIYASNVGGTGYIAYLWDSIDAWGATYPDVFEQNVMAPRFLTVDGQKYYMYVSAPSKYGYLRVIPIEGESYKAAFEALVGVDLGANSYVYPLVIPGDKDGAGRLATNGTGFLDYTTIDGEIYVVAGATENGWSCFKFQ